LFIYLYESHSLCGNSKDLIRNDDITEILNTITLTLTLDTTCTELTLHFESMRGIYCKKFI
jgi:hypothetical protein